MKRSKSVLSRLKLLLGSAIICSSGMAWAQATTLAVTLRPFQQVEVEDTREKGVWDSCQVLAVHAGAYTVTCRYTNYLRRDIHVRALKGQAVAQTAAAPVIGPPFKRGDLVLGSLQGLPNRWELCIVMRNRVEEANHYELDCGNGPRVVQPDWVRIDPDAPS